MNKKFAIGGLWLLSIIAALFVGSSMQTSVPSSQITQIPHSTPSQHSDCGSCDKNQVAEKDSKTHSKASQHSTESTHKLILGELAEELTLTVSNTDHHKYDMYKGIATSWDKIKTLSEEELYTLYDLIKENSENGVNRNIANMIYTRLADINPVKALDHIYDNKKHHALYGVMNHWCKRSF